MSVARTAVAGGGVLAALVAAWFIPPLAIAVVWPLLLAVPGLGILAVVRPRIDSPGRLGLAIVISVAVSTHLVYWLSVLAGGYGREVVFVAAAILALPIPVAAWFAPRPLARVRVRPSMGPSAIVAVLATLVVGVTLGVGIWRITDAGVTSGGSNWSDLGVHLSIAQTLNAGANFPPEVPYFAGVPLVYHWFADFHAAILAEAAAMFSVPAMVVQSSILAASLALLGWSLARRLVRGRMAVRIATIAAALIVFGGGLGYIRFVGDISTGGSPLDLIAKNSYDNQWLTGWPYFRIPSVMGTGLLAHRATTAGLPLLVGAILLFVAGLPTAAQRRSGWRDRPALLALAGLVGALLAPFHFFFFPLVPLLALAWAITGRRAWDDATPRNVAAFGVPYLAALPFVIAPIGQASGSGALRWVWIWQSAPYADGVAAVIFFYLTNLGIPFVLAIFALLMPRVPRGAFLGTWLVACFLIPNLVQVSVIDFDMNKLFQAMWIAVGILAAWFIRRWPMPAIAAVVLLSVPSPLLVAGWTATSKLQFLSSDDLAAADWVAENTPPGAVFVTDNWISSLTDAAGRKRLTTFAPYIANLGYRPDERVADVQAMYCGGDAERSAELMRRYGAAYLVEGNRPQPCVDPVDFSTSGAFELVYEANPRIWRLVD